MSREWRETISPRFLHETIGVYNGIWMPQMDRCWNSNDGYQVTSRILITEWGKVEHAAITQTGDKKHIMSFDGSRDIPWAIKQEIKNEIFGENRIAIEVFPETKKLVDVLDVYHLWIFPKGFSLPFGIHPTRDKQCRVVNRGIPKNIDGLVEGGAEMLGINNENGKCQRID